MNASRFPPRPDVRLFIGLAAPLVAPLVHGQDLVVLSETGPRSERVNVVVVAEGYTAPELDGFPAHAQGLVSHLFSEEPFLRYASYFNAYALKVVSAESGADQSDRNPPIFVDTAFDAQFNTNGIPRLLTVSTSKVRSALFGAVPEFDIALVLVNSTRYGGAGGSVAVTSRSPSAPEIAAHEIGHSFGRLADEYETAGGSPREAPNATQETGREQIRWERWIDGATPVPTPETSSFSAVVGLFEGAVYRPSGWYRPHLNSKMRSLGRAWGAVNSEQLIKQIYSRVGLFAPVSPVGDMVVLDGPQDVSFEVDVNEPAGIPIELSWEIAGVVAPQESGERLDFPLGMLGNGSHEVAIEARDPTAMVRDDPEGLLTERRVWSLSVTGFETFASWEAIHFPDVGTVSGGAGGDPDSDGWSNLAEYGLSGDPTVPEGLSSLYEAHVPGDGGVAIAFVRDPRRSDLSVSVEGSDGLHGWTQIAWSDYGGGMTGSGEIDETLLPDGRVRSTVRKVDPGDIGRYFFRIVFELEREVDAP